MAKRESKKPTGAKAIKKTSVPAKTTSKKAADTSDTSAQPKRSVLKKIFRSPFRGYFIGSWREIKKVEWPDRKTSWKLTFIVIMFSVVFSLFTSGLDLGFEKLAKQIFLK